MLRQVPEFRLYFGTLTFLFGLCMGSFLNCMAWRIVHGEKITRGRSHCDVCGHVLTAGELIPVVSFLAHRGRCRWCGTKLSARHVLCELSCGVSYALLLLKFDLSLQALQALLLASVLLASAFADLEGMIIPDRFILAGIVLCVPFWLLPDRLTDLPDALLGGFAVGGGLLAVVLVYERLRGVEAMGGGDLKLLFVTGLYLGWARNLLCLLLACLFGIAFSLAAARTRRAGGEAKQFPFGPAICAAGIVTLLCGNEIIGAYLGLF